MSYQLGKNITATVTYYDVMNFPLTAFEIWKHLLEYNREGVILDQSVTLRAAWEVLHSGQLAGKIAEAQGLYFLVGREALVTERVQREKLSVKKLKRMQQLMKWLTLVPYLRMVGATGSLAMKHGDMGSDWDMFVVLKRGRIWIGRTVLTLFLHVIGKRRHGKKVSNRACLNYFVTDDTLEIGTKDLFSAHEYRFLIPLWSFSLFQTFERKNVWMKLYKPNFSQTMLPSRWLVESTPLMQKIQGQLERLLDAVDCEGFLRAWQQKKIAANPKTHLEGSLIEASDEALVFLPRPRGPRVFEKFKERLSV